MNTELSSKYDPSAVEATAYQVWLDEKCFHADPAKPGEPYTIVIPPPNVTGALHLGHAINNTLQDILTRAHRMMGFNTLWVPGIDHAGIATQAVVEKQLKEQENKTRHDVGREGLVERIWQWKQQYGDRILSQLQRLGCSCDWDRTRFTLDEMCAKAVRETFFKLFKDGLIYRGKRLVNWDTFLQTSISDDEIYHENVKTSLWHLRYPIEGQTSASDTGIPPVPVARSVGETQSSETASNEHGRDARVTTESCVGSAARTDSSASEEMVRRADPTTSQDHGRAARATYMVVATTRPETMLGDTAVAVHSEDPRWNWAIGKHVRLPLTGRLIPIIADDILVDPKFGTGVVKVTPAHDPNDYAVWSRHKGQGDEIEIINILTPDGKITSDRPEWSKYAGMKRAAARTAVVDDLKAAGLLEKEEPYETQVGHSDRSKTPVEPYLSDQWFVKMAPLAEPALEVVREGKIKFYPERHAQQYLAWLGEKRDWPVSRQLWWGHRIPVWHMRWYGEPENVTEAEARALKNELALTQQKGLEQFAAELGIENDISIQTSPDSCELRVCARSFRAEQVLNQLVTATDKWKHGARKRSEFETSGYSSRQIDLLFDLASSSFSEVVQDPDVLDTWFSSALWPHSTLGWPERTPELAKYYPTSVLLTGRDIITLWVARMVMMGMYNMGSGSEGEKGREGEGETKTDHTHSSPALPHSHSPTRSRYEEARTLGLPFLDVAINPTILDGKGERMSKMKGNGVDPVDIIFSHGADALRFTLTTMATETQDARMPVQVVCPHCSERMPNPDSKEPEMICAKCKKKFTRPILNSKGSEAAPLARMTSEKFDLGRNFCNKLWNACRFALSNLESAASVGQGAGLAGGAGASRPETDRDGPALPATTSPSSSGASDVGANSSVDQSKWTLADQWIIARFHRAVDESNQALKAYRFDVYAKACYDFFWRDFCDWYVEVIKPAMKDPARAPRTGNVLAAVLDGALRLMHPMIPFITETIWWRLNDIRPQRGLGDLLPCPPSKRLVLAQWPGTSGTSKTPSLRYSEESGYPPSDPGLRSTSDPALSANAPASTTGGGSSAETTFTKLQELIVAIRTVRNDYQVNPKQAVKVSIKTSAELAGHIESNRELIELLASCFLQTVGPAIAPVANAVTASAAGSEIFVEGLIDPNAEKLRLVKEIEAKDKSVAALNARLGNEAYLAKAPPNLVRQTKDQLAAAEMEVVKMKEALKKLE